MEEALVKIGRNQFKCFHCRLIFAQRDGDWFYWDDMQVHLCRSCEKLTNKKEQRSFEMKKASAS